MARARPGPPRPAAAPRRRCRCVAAAGGASAGATWAPTATSSSCAPRGYRWARSDRRFGRSGTASAARCGSAPACGSRARAARSGRRRTTTAREASSTTPPTRARWCESRRAGARARCGPSSARAPAGGWRRCVRTGRASTCGPESGPTSRWSATSASASAAGGSRRAGWRTSRPAITLATRCGAGPPASDAPATGARSAGTWSAASTTRRSAPSGRSGWTASRSSPARSSFEGLEAIAFDDGSRLEFSGECERRKQENRLLVRYTYRQPFGRFAGTLPGGLELERGLGVMEHHDAHW